VKNPVQMECVECKNRNYSIFRDTRGNVERLELKKYCRFCRKHTLHKQRRK